MNNPTCLFCQAPFKPNRVLASIPEARRIAFDPDNGRVWRICDQCHEWNLLGPEAASDALPELRARFQAGDQGTVADDFVVAEVHDTLVLWQLGNVGSVSQEALFTKRRARELLRQHRNQVLVFGALVLWLVYRFVEQRWSLPVISGILIGVGAIELMQQAADRRAGMLTHWRGAPAYAIAAVTGAIGLMLTAPAWWPVLPLVAGGGWWASRHLTPRVALHLELDGESAIRLSEEQADAIRFGWNPDTFELLLTDLPGGAVWRGPPAEALLQILLSRENGTRSRRVLEHGQRLAEEVGNAKGLLRMLEGVRSSSGNRIAIAALPPVYQVSLDLLLAGDITFLGDTDQLQERKEEAVRVAAEAEALDRQLKS